MTKQTLLALLAAIFATMTLALACGSSETPTEVTEPRPTNPAQQPQAEEKPSPTPAETTSQQPADQSPPADTFAANVNQPLPTPLPTKPPVATQSPTKATLLPQPMTDSPPPSPTSMIVLETPAAPAPVTLPEYDGSSPLIHIYFDKPWYIGRREEGWTTKLKVFGLTEAGQHVHITDLKKHNVTIEPFDDRFTNITEDGTLIVTDPKFEHIGLTVTHQHLVHSSHVILLRQELHITIHDTQHFHLPCNISLMEYSPTTSDYIINSNTFFVYYEDNADLQSITNQIQKTGADLHTPANDRWKDNFPFRNTNHNFLIFTYLPPTCPALEEITQLAHQWSKIPGVTNVVPQDDYFIQLYYHLLFPKE